MVNNKSKRDKYKTKAGTKSAPEQKNKNTSQIFTYSAIEQKRHGIAGPGKCLMIFLGIFPFVPLCLALISCFVMKLEDKTYKAGMFAASFILVAVMLTCMVLWIKQIFYVFIIDDKECLYRLRISNFWYKIKNQTFMLNPMGTSGGRFLRLFYMVNNIKYVLENITDTITYEELIQMGRMEQFTEISGVVVRKKKIIFNTKIKGAGREEVKRITISRVYENDRQLVNYLMHRDYRESEPVSRIVEEIRQADTPVRKIVRFTLNWSCIIAWASVIFLSRDLGRLSKINAGEYVKSEVEIQVEDRKVKKEAYVSLENEKNYFLVSDYGNLYKPIFVIYGSVELLYLVGRCTDLAIGRLKKEKE